jgi:ribosomal subunit interface protein
MIIDIKWTNVVRDEDVRAYVEEKVRACEKMLHEESVAGAVCAVELEKSAHHHKGDVFRAEVTLEAEGKVYRVSKTEPTIRKAIDKMKDDLIQALRVDKHKKEHLFMKGARKIKEWMKR